MAFTGPDIRRFMDKVHTSEGCHLWTAGKTAAGYGQFRYGGRALYSHRVAYTLTHGEIPAGAVVCHSCDTPACVNPAHLFLGTEQDNKDDMVRKDRVQHGMRHWNRRLAPPDVEAIRAEYSRGGISQSALARRYGVDPSVVSRIMTGDAWRRVTSGGGHVHV